MRRFILALGVVCVGLAGVTARAQSVSPATTYVVLGGSGAVARAVLVGSQACPAIDIDGVARPMSIRQVPVARSADFPVTVCEAVVPTDAATAQISGQRLPLLPKALKRIAGIGDTGCRLKQKNSKAVSLTPGSSGSPAVSEPIDHDHEPGKFQDCDVPDQWPFAKLARTLAKARPDVVLHVGDYLYREAACPAGDKGCAGSPYGDNWLTWQADFFKPATPLLQAAPWVAVRGNHEICKRNGAGYLLFLDPRLAVNGVVASCDDVFPSYTVKTEGQAFVVIDTSNADDQCSPTSCNSAAYAPVFSALAPTANSWLVTHKPIWAIRKGPEIVTPSLQAALVNGQLPQGLSLALAGHVHFWQILGFADGRPPQMVLGNGGTLLTHKPKGQLVGTSIAGTTVRYAKTHVKWGYTLFVRKDEDWKATYFSVGGNKKFDCKLDGGAVGCK